jgi:hypothetical protein
VEGCLRLVASYGLCPFFEDVEGSLGILNVHREELECSCGSSEKLSMRDQCGRSNSWQGWTTKTRLLIVRVT